jgi:SNF2 family DNA or RNA helicase
MPPEQFRVYRQRITDSAAPISGNSSNEALRRIQAIRQVSDHPFLNTDDFLDRSVEDLIGSSARLIATTEILNHVHKQGERAIIFAEFRKTQHLLAKVIEDRYGLDVSIINGDTPVMASRGRESRQRTIARFNEAPGFNVIVMSPIAAGVGLNVTGANHVIHYSRHWNPARENQATDRAYRIGQEKTVYVYYPQAISSEGPTFDVVINELLQQKTNLASAMLYPTDAIEVKPTDLLGRLSLGA